MKYYIDLDFWNIARYHGSDFRYDMYGQTFKWRRVSYAVMFYEVNMPELPEFKFETKGNYQLVVL